MKKLLLVLVLAANALAIPQLVNYQGQLTSPTGTPLDTTVAMTFNIWPSPVGGVSVWTESHPAVVVTNGLFNVQLGSISPLTDLFSTNRWLGITIGNNTEMIPREQLVSVAHAYRVSTVDGATGGTITGDVRVEGRGNIGTANGNSGLFAFVAGDRDTASGLWSAVSGGNLNKANGNYSAISGGQNNLAFGTGSSVAGGRNNAARGAFSAIGGGGDSLGSISNSTEGAFTVIAGGRGNYISDSVTTAGVISGGEFNSINSGEHHVIGGGQGNTASGVAGATIAGGANNSAIEYATVGGGNGNLATGVESTISGGVLGIASALGASVGGGIFNNASGSYAVIGGGEENTATLARDVVSGGAGNSASGVTFGYASVGGGHANTASGDYSVVAGGDINIASGLRSTVAGGGFNTASGDYTFAVGHNAEAVGNNSTAMGTNVTVSADSAFAWSDGSGPIFSIGSDNTFNLKANAGFRFWTTANHGDNIGARLPANSSAWTTLSDSTRKHRYGEVNGKEILDKVCQLPIETWSYRADPQSFRHISPMAQDFWKAFQLGDDSLSISTIDPSGVALAAIQELAKQNEQKDTKITDLEAHVKQLEAAILQFGNLINSDK